MLNNEAVLLVDWLNLSIHLRNKRLMFGADLIYGLMQLAQEQCEKRGNIRLARAHFVAENFSPHVEKAIENTLLAERHKTRTAKEQADLVLAVLAMDALHTGTGCPSLFFLATGDQDFIPLIERIVREGAQVALIVADTDKLTPEYKSIAAQQNVILLPLTEHVHLKRIPDAPEDKQATSVLGLLRVCMSGGVLGGDQTRNTQLMSQWNILPPGEDEEAGMAGLIHQFTRVDQRSVAVPGKSPTGNRAEKRRRTSLDFNKPIVAITVAEADYVLRRVGSARRPCTIGDLSGGLFNDSEGRKLDQIIASLKAIGWLNERSDERFEAATEWASDGLLEPIWRVICEVNRRAYDERSDGVARDDLFHDLRNTPIAYDGNRRGGVAANQLITMAKSIGVIDTVPVGRDGCALKVIDNHPIARQVTEFLRSLAQLIGSDVGNFIPEHEMLRRMRNRDEPSARPVFGYDVRDRQRILRVLRRSRLIDRREDPEVLLKLKNSAWLRKLLPQRVPSR